MTKRSKDAYIYGTALRDYDVVSAMEAEPAQKVSEKVKHTREKNALITLPYILFLTAALVISSYSLIQYIQVRSEITNSVKHISSLEKELNNAKMANDEAQSKIDSSIDLDEIRRIATDKLGMVYAKEGQVITYSGEGDDYVRQSSGLK